MCLEHLITSKHPQDKESAPTKPLILFDLNGVLICESKRDDKLRRVSMRIRPGYERILELIPYYNIGIFSSATARTVQRALGALSNLLKDTRIVAPKMLDVLPGRQVWNLFSTVMNRSNCIPDESWRSRPDGRDYDTLKPLARNGLDPLMTFLIDNHARKAAPGEESNVLIMPTWEQCRDSGVATWNCVIDGLLLAAKIGLPQDIRLMVKTIGEKVMKIHLAMPPPEEIILDEDEDEDERVAEEGESEREEEEQRGSKLIKTSRDGDISHGLEGGTSPRGNPQLQLGVSSPAGIVSQGERQRPPGAQPLYDSHLIPPLPPNGSRGRTDFSQLHSEMESFASRAQPTRSEMDLVARTLRTINSSVLACWPHAHTCLFGSQASGLALPGADLDVVILGVVEDLATPGSGFGKRGKNAAVDHLNKLANFLRKNRLIIHLQVIHARVPIIKAVFPAQDGSSIPADISIGVANGASAVAMVRHAVMLLPPLRPLVLVLKALLRETKLNEVFSGGLSSYSLVNMVIAHLQCEGFRAHGVAEAGRAPASSAIINSMGMMQEQGDFARLIERGVDQSHDLGCLLLSFLRRFGSIFNYHEEAVSVSSGGIVRKPSGWKRDRKRDGNQLALGIEDPQQAHRDIGSGSHNIQKVKRIFSEALSALEDGIRAASSFSASSVVPLVPPPSSVVPLVPSPSVASQPDPFRASSEGRGPPMSERERWQEIQKDGQSQSMSIDQGRPSTSKALFTTSPEAERSMGPSVLDFVFDVSLCLARDPNAVKVRSSAVARLTQRKDWLRSMGREVLEKDEGVWRDEADTDDDALDSMQRLDRKKRKRQRLEEKRAIEKKLSLLGDMTKKERKRARRELEKEAGLAPVFIKGVQKKNRSQEGRMEPSEGGSHQPWSQMQTQAFSLPTKSKGPKPMKHPKNPKQPIVISEEMRQQQATDRWSRHARRANERGVQKKAREIQLNPKKVVAEIDRLRGQLQQAQAQLRQNGIGNQPGLKKKGRKKLKKKERLGEAKAKTESKSPTQGYKETSGGKKRRRRGARGKSSNRTEV